MKKVEQIDINEETEEFDRKNLILLLELFILVFITVLFALAYKDDKDNNAKVTARGLNSSFSYSDASEDINYWLLNNNSKVESFDVVSLKEQSNTCYDFIIKYTCDNKNNDCILINGNNVSSKTEDKLIVSGSIRLENEDTIISAENCK